MTRFFHQWISPPLMTIPVHHTETKRVVQGAQDIMNPDINPTETL